MKKTGTDLLSASLFIKTLIKPHHYSLKGVSKLDQKRRLGVSSPSLSASVPLAPFSTPTASVNL